MFRRQLINIALASFCALVEAQTASDIDRFESLIKQQKFTEATAGLQTYTGSHPDSWQAWYQLGYAQFRLHRIQPSLASLCKSLAIHTEFAESHKILAFDLNILGRQDLAIHELEQALRLDPESPESHYELGRIYYERGSYLQAVQHLEKAKSLSPSYIRAYHNLGLAYSAVGERAKAIENFETALRLNSAQATPSAWPYIDYATYCNMQNDFEKARDLLLQAIQIDPSWDQAFDELGKAYRGLNMPADAIVALKKAITINPRKPEYHYVLARLYAQTHELDKAKQEVAEYEQQKNRETK
jgi:tetratricopeptide (TPR) repeat protein